MLLIGGFSFMNDEKKYSILIVDDEKLNLMVLNQILSSDFTIYTAKTGATALSRANELVPDLILLDIMLPDMSGFEVLDKLKTNPHTSNSPVIFITGLNSIDDEEKGLLMGAVDYITKPFNHTIVKVRVKTHIQILQNYRTIEHVGLIDPLTELPNRRSFDKRIDMEWKRSIRDQNSISFLMIDIDHFKMYNDTYGHLQGDTLLRAVAKVFSSILKRPADSMVRFGGEEFGVLLPDTPWHAALMISEKIRTTIKSTIVPTIDGKINTSITISIGLVTARPQKGDSLRDFLSTADEYLYKAKKSGRDKVYSESVNCL
jgi:diguanylate cyclase (GGDEF)-like protein